MFSFVENAGNHEKQIYIITEKISPLEHKTLHIKEYMLKNPKLYLNTSNVDNNEIVLTHGIQV